MPKKQKQAEKPIAVEEKTEEPIVTVPASAITPEVIVEEKVEIVDVEEVTKPEVGGFDKTAWKPHTSLGLRVKSGEVTHIDQILDARERILEAEIVDAIMPNLKTELLMIGQAKGKFGGGQKRVFKQTQKKTKEGNKPNFSTFALVGNEDGYVGMGYGKAKETVPAREKSIRNAKLNIIKIRRGNGTWQDSGNEPNTIPFIVRGKCGSIRVTLMPAPRGTGLCISQEAKKILQLAGVKDVWSKIEGRTHTKTNVLRACFDAMKQLMEIKVRPEDEKALNMVEGSLVKAE